MTTATTKAINRSSKAITIMFTDIVDSTRYWDSQGDLNGRLMVDQHNRLVFPVIKRFKGNIIKTIGDSVMASFKTPENALRAAAGIQQSIEAYRRNHENFKLEVRIGLHTGEALVEKNDVFGDTVNVAARVEAEADANEVLVSKSTVDLVAPKDYFLSRKTSFLPKGKTKKTVVYKCNWQKLPNQIEGINFEAILPLLAQQRTEILVYLMAIFAFIYYAIQNYLRYILADQEYVYLLSFSPQQMLSEHPVITGIFILAAFALFRLIKLLTVIPVTPFRLIKAGFGYALAFALVLTTLTLAPAEYTANSQDTFNESKHLFVKVLQSDANIRQKPSLTARVVASANEDDLYLLADVTESEKIVWNKILIGIGEYGWIARSVPAAFGVAEKRLTLTNKHSMRYLDIYAFLAGILGFIWGFFSFSIRPL